MGDTREDSPEIGAPVNTYSPSLEVPGLAADTKEPWELVGGAYVEPGVRGMMV